MGVRTNPVVDGETIPLVLLPEIQYYGERFFLNNLDFGYTLHESEYQTLNLLLTPGYDQLFFNRWDPQNFFVERSVTLTNAPADFIAPSAEAQGEKWVAEERIDMSLLHERRMAALAGMEYSGLMHQLEFYAQALQDVSGVHNGQEVRVGLGRSWRYGKSQWALTGGLVWQSDELLHYYYGVRTDEVARPSAAYRAGSGTSGMVKLDWSRPINTRWSWRGSLQYKALSQAISDSPIVDDNKVITAFIGGVYHF